MKFYEYFVVGLLVVLILFDFVKVLCVGFFIGGDVVLFVVVFDV